MRILILLLLLSFGPATNAQIFEALIPGGEPDPDTNDPAHKMICFDREDLKESLQAIDSFDGFYLRYIDRDQAKAIRRAGCKLDKLPAGTAGYSSGYLRTNIVTRHNEEKTFIFSLYSVTLPASGYNRYIADSMYPGELFRIVDSRRSADNQNVCPNGRRWCLEPVDCSVQSSQIGLIAENNGDTLRLNCRKKQF
jgi:hypothetical protein